MGLLSGVNRYLFSSLHSVTYYITHKQKNIIITIESRHITNKFLEAVINKMCISGEIEAVRGRQKKKEKNIINIAKLVKQMKIITLKLTGYRYEISN